MPNSIALLLCLHPEMTMTTIRQFSRIALALLAMTGRVTMLSISRWSGQGGSYRTVQRFFATALPWAALFWLFFASTSGLFNPRRLFQRLILDLEGSVAVARLVAAY
jgi:DDE superfamily endonuclease